MRATLFLLALSSCLAATAAPLAARATPPKGWIQSILEPYNEYNTRYLRVGCHKQHHTQFFKDCCSPMKVGETLEKNRKPECVVTYTAPAPSAPAPVQAKPTTAPVVDAATDAAEAEAEEDDLEECDDEDDVVEEDDDEECAADTDSDDEEDEEADDEEDCEDEEEAEPTALPTAQPTSAPKPSSAPEPSSSTPKPSSPAPEPTSSATPAPTSAEAPTSSSKPPATTTKESSSSPKPTEAPESDDEETFTGGQATFYDQNGNAGACGNFRKDSDLIVAMDYRFYGPLNKKSDFCGRKVVITNTDNGKTVTATVEDACPSCKNKNSLDLSRGAYNAIGAEEKGILPIKWHFA